MKNVLKRMFSLCLSLFFGLGMVAACSGGQNEVLTDNDYLPNENPNGNAPLPEVSLCTHSYSETVKKEAKVFEPGIKRLTCQLCRHTYEEAIPATKSLKVLAIGNSYSVDALEYFKYICMSAGIETLRVGNLTIAGCTLEMHWNNIQTDAANYDYTKWTERFGPLISSTKMKISEVITSEDWDYIIVNGHPHSSGMPNAFVNIKDIFAYIKGNCPKNTKTMFHMTWANQQNDTNSWFFTNYKGDQLTMYNAIVSTAVENVMVYEDYVNGLVPSGTAIQNLRTSYIGDTLTRDGYHMSESYGRYTVALTWFAELTGGSVELVTYVPSTVDEKDVPAIREAVSNAIDTPYKITDSTYTQFP